MGGKREPSQFFGEQYERRLRVTPQFTRSMFHEIEEIRNNLDFKHPRFAYRAKRSNSTASALAFLTEICMTDEKIRQRLLEVLPHYMMNKGADWKFGISYQDRY